MTACTATSCTEMALICLYVGLRKHVAKRVHIGITGGAQRQMFHDFAFVPLSKSCFPARAASSFSQNDARSDAKMWKYHLKCMR